MQKLRNKIYEGKNQEEILNKALSDLNASKEEVYYSFSEEVTGNIFKTKKFKLNIILKDDLIEYVKLYLKEVIELMGIKAEFETQKREKYIKINMLSDNNAILIGKNGRTMASLQTLLRQTIHSKLNINVNIILDANEYKEKQERNIERLAKNLAREVRKTKVDVKMDSMNSYERRLVHNALTNFKGVTTKSEGEEPNRYVVIKAVEE